MKSLKFVDIGGKQRPVAYNLNVDRNVKRALKREIPDLESDMERALEGIEGAPVGERQQRIQNAQLAVGAQHESTMSTITIFQMLKEGHRIAGWDFERDVYRLKPNAEGGIDREKVGTRDIEMDDVGEWLTELSDEADDAIADLMGYNELTEQQADVFERDQAGAEADDEEDGDADPGKD